VFNIVSLVVDLLLLRFLKTVVVATTTANSLPAVQNADGESGEGEHLRTG
jgi:hypothetical protein